MNARDFTIGTHNLHDRAGVPTFFADLVLFTEAIPTTIRARAKVRAPGRELLVCRRQPDLAISLRPKLFEVTGREYRLAHGGKAGVTPHRGTYVVKARHRPTDRKVAAVAEHRINAAFDPWVRGEPAFREDCWHRHTQLTLDWLEELKDDDFLIVAGGDLNTPHGVSGYEGRLEERGAGLERLGVSHSIYLDRLQALGRKGSDHVRLRAAVNLPGHAE